MSWLKGTNLGWTFAWTKPDIAIWYGGANMLRGHIDERPLTSGMPRRQLIQYNLRSPWSTFDANMDNFQ